MRNSHRKTLWNLLSTIIFIFIFVYITVFIVKMPRNFTIKVIDGNLVETVPMSMIIKNTNDTVWSILTGNLGSSTGGKPLLPTVLKASKNTILLLLWGIILGFIVGILKGIFDSNKNHGKKSSFKILLSMIPISFPDVLIVAIFQYFAIWLIKHGIKIFKVGGGGTINHALLPIITLSILPACYIARITAMAIEACYEKEFIIAAVGKGCSGKRILWNHVMRNAMPSIIDSLPNIAASIIGNMIIVEYMFAYPGLTTSLMSFYKWHDSKGIIAVILMIGFVYALMNELFAIVKNLVAKTSEGESL